jgi:ABC-2 type transport system permease protein
MNSFRSLSIAMLKGFLRDRGTLFFALLFPLVLLIILGLVLGNQGASKTDIGLVGAGPVISSLAHSAAVQAEWFDDIRSAEKKVRSGDLPAVVMELGDQVQLRYAASDQVQAATVQRLVAGATSETNLAATGQPPRFVVNASQIEDQALRPIQYMTPGILCWSVAMGAVFGAALTFVNWRRKQVLRRLQLSPVSVWTVLTSRIVVTLVLALVQAVVFVGVALLPILGLHLSGQWWLGIPLLLIGTLAFFSVGMLLGAFCKTEEAASGAANLIILPMAFLSGAFFPLDHTPPWLQSLSLVLPMRHLNDGMTAVLVRGRGVEAILVPCIVLIGFTVVVGVLAAKVFRWEDN